MYRIKDAYYYLRNRFFRKYYLIDTHLSKGSWHDSDYKILHGMMSVLVDFVEKEQKIVDWTTDPEHQKAYDEFMSIYKWWKDYPNREKLINDKLHEWYDTAHPLGRDELGFNLNIFDSLMSTSKKIEANELSEELHQMEQKLKEEEQEMLHKLINIRSFLWT